MLECREAYRQYVKGLSGILPNAAQRICTGELKVKPMHRFACDLWGVRLPTDYHIALALRADEAIRVASAQERNPEGGLPRFPLFDAGITKDDVIAFWKEQPFQLGMRAYEGNCTLCHLKKNHALERLIRRYPPAADWWIDWERRARDHFRRKDESYAALKYKAEHQQLLFDEPDELETVITCESGYCSN